MRCGEAYPILQGVAILASEGHRRVPQETHEVEDHLRLLGPHGVAHWGDLLPEADREGLPLGDFWPRLGALPAGGLAVDLACSAGRGRARALPRDKDGNLVYLAESAWIIKSLQQDFPEIRFHYTSEFKREMQEAG